MNCRSERSEFASLADEDIAKVIAIAIVIIGWSER
jgi:hypothetical protein